MQERHQFEDFTLAALRIAAGLGFFTHGGQKIFGWFGGFGARVFPQEVGDELRLELLWRQVLHVHLSP